MRRQEREQYDSLGAAAGCSKGLQALCLQFRCMLPCLPLPVLNSRRPSPSPPAEKLKLVQQLCGRLGVHTAPACVGGVWIVPLLSW